MQSMGSFLDSAYCLCVIDTQFQIIEFIEAKLGFFLLRLVIARSYSHELPDAI